MTSTSKDVIREAGLEVANTRIWAHTLKRGRRELVIEGGL